MSIFDRPLFHGFKDTDKVGANDRKAGENITAVANIDKSPPLSPAKESAPPENGAELLDEIVAATRNHVVLPDRGAELIALFALHANAHEAAQCSPILAIGSPTTACGKSTLLGVLKALTPEPLVTSDITAPGLFRTITAGKHTLLIDEGGRFLPLNGRLQGIISSGYSRDQAHVVRADGVFNAWCPKAIALIGELPAALRDRSLKIRLQRKLPNETVAPLDEAAKERLRLLGDRTATWAAANLDRLAKLAPAIPSKLVNRAADNWRPLLAIADLAGGHWPQTARSIALKIAHTDKDVSLDILLLGDIRIILLSTKADKYPTDGLIEALATMEERPWAQYDRGRPITPSQLAKLLKPWGISPRTLRFGADLARGYRLDDFQDAFSRYL
jgi:hypothetical protein